MDLVRKFKRRLRSIGGASGITATAGAGGSSAECAGDWPSGVISKSFSVECGVPHAGPNPLLGATNSHARPVPKNHSSNTCDSRLQGKELQPEASGVTNSEEEDRRQRSSRPPRRTQRAVSQQQRDAGAGKPDQRCRADECAGGASESGSADHSRGSRSDVEDCGSDEIKGDDLQRRHTWQVQTQRHASDVAAAAALPESAKAFANNRHSSSNRNDDFSYEFAQSASFVALGSLPGTGAALPPRLTEAQLLLIQAAQHASSSGLAIDWARQQQQQHRKVTEWLGTLSDPVDPLTETPFANAELPQEASASKADHAAAEALLAGRAPRVAACVSPSDIDGCAASLSPPADGDMLQLPASLTVNRPLKLESAGSPSGTPSPGVPSPRGVIMRGSGGTGSSGDGEEAENGQRKANGRRDCEAIKAEARDDWAPGCERTARRDCKGSCSDGDGSECGGDIEGGSRGGKWGPDDAATACVSKHPVASDNALLTSVHVAFNQLVATRQSEQVRGARALRDLARESDAVRSSIVAVGAIPALVSIVNLAATAPHAAAAGDTTVASLIFDGGDGAAAETGAPLGGTRLHSASCEEGGNEAAAQGGRERALTSPLVDYSISCLVNLSITRDMKATICQAGAVPPLIRLMCSARSPSCAPACACCAPTSASTRANAAVALLSLSKLSDATRLHMAYSGGVEALVHFLSDSPSDAPDCPAAAAGAPATGGLQGSGSSKSCKGRREAAAALQSLASVPAVRPRLVHAGAVPLLLGLVGHAAASHLTCSSRLRGAERRTQKTSRTEDNAVATAERALAVLALLAESEEGRAEVQRRGGMEVLVGVVRAGGPSGTCVERAISGLTAMVGGSLNCRWEVTRIGVEGAVKEVAIHGSGKAKIKAIKFMDMLRAPPALG
ncbi:unnamed protein product [Closterium sp. NIES-53]